MANKGVEGRIIDAQTSAGFSGLKVTAVDFDPFFNEDDVLATGETDANGQFSLSYAEDAYRLWKLDRNPDIVVRIYSPTGRLLHETKEAEDVTDETLSIPDVRIHPNHVNGHLVTHATLNPETGDPVALFPKNEINFLVDGAKMFPAVTEGAKAAGSAINLMTLFFDVDNGLITQFKSEADGFDPLSPPAANCKEAIAATLEEELKKKADPPGEGETGIPVNVLVTNIPLSASDTVAEVRKFFLNTSVKTSDFNRGFALLHAKAITFDGTRAILMGSPLKQFYFSDGRHSIRDSRHKGSLMHDVSLEVAGPAVKHIDKTFATVWRGTGKPFTLIPKEPEERTGPNTASVQVLRTLPGDTFKGGSGDEAEGEDLPSGETGILEAYQRAIALAERYIYFENQYFTSPEIVDALTVRMKDSAKPKLQIIMVLNFRPDLPGYPDQQIEIVARLKALAEANGHQMGVYTLWSRAEKAAEEGTKSFEIMPIYVHSKVGIIDDTWATVGSANLDGTSMNYHQIGLMVSSVIVDKLISKATLGDNFPKFLWDAYWYLVFYVFKQYLFNLKTVLIVLFLIYKAIFDFKEILETLTEITDLPEIAGDVFARTAEHALPNRSRQPSRSVELNLVMYNGIAGQPASPVVRQLRDILWTEHLGFETLPSELRDVPPNPEDMNWVAAWDARAKENLAAITNNTDLPEGPLPHILEWKPETDPDDYLEALKIRTKGLRDKADRYDFEKCRLDPKKKLLPWPII